MINEFGNQMPQKFKIGGLGRPTQYVKIELKRLRDQSVALERSRLINNLTKKWFAGKNTFGSAMNPDITNDNLEIGEALSHEKITIAKVWWEAWLIWQQNRVQITRWLAAK